MTWVENLLNFTKSYYRVTSNAGDELEYLVPFPLGYTSTMEAHWTTDVIVLDPSCSWQTATKTQFSNSSWDVTLPESSWYAGGNWNFPFRVLKHGSNSNEVSRC